MVYEDMSNRRIHTEPIILAFDHVIIVIEGQRDIAFWFYQHIPNLELHRLSEIRSPESGAMREASFLNNATGLI